MIKVGSKCFSGTGFRRLRNHRQPRLKMWFGLRLLCCSLSLYLCCNQILDVFQIGHDQISSDGHVELWRVLGLIKGLKHIDTLSTYLKHGIQWDCFIWGQDEILTQIDHFPRWTRSRVELMVWWIRESFDLGHQWGFGHRRVLVSLRTAILLSDRIWLVQLFLSFPFELRIAAVA